MTLSAKHFYWLTCDGCQVKSTENGEYAAWIDEEQAFDDALNSDWTLYDSTVYGNVHLCYKCTPKNAEGEPRDDAFPRDTVRHSN